METTARNALPDITPLLTSLTGAHGMEKAFCKALIAAVALNRTEEHYLQREERATEPAAQDISRSDVDLIKAIIGDSPDPQKLMFNLGACSGQELIGTALDGLTLTDAQHRELDGGRTHAVLGSLSDIKVDDDFDQSRVTSALDKTSGELCCYIIMATIDGSLHRKNYLRLLNAVVLLEECGAVLSGGAGRADKDLRKDALDYALMRLIGTISRMDGLDLHAIKSIFLMTGRASRLNLQISDALDRVDKYCHAAASDPDQIDRARASGRPFPDSLGDIATSARQCRLYRDRALRQKI